MKGFLIIITLFVACFGHAQMDVICLKNGSEIRGVILEKTESTIKVKTKDGSIWVFDRFEVNEIKPFRPVVAKSGYYGTISGSVLGGSAISGALAFTNGYRINEHWSAGLGLGLDFFYSNIYLPVFLEGKYDILKKGSTPYVSLGLGYDIPFEITDNNRGGFFGQGLIGFKHELGQHFGIITGIGFRYGRLEVESWNWWGSNMKTIYEINRFDLRFGFIFR